MAAVLLLPALLLAAVVIYNHDDVERTRSPGGAFELVSGAEPEVSGTDSFYLVRVGSQTSPADEVLRTGLDCKRPLVANEDSKTEPKVVCAAVVGFRWASATEVDFTIGGSIRVLKQVEQAHGVNLVVHRSK